MFHGSERGVSHHSLAFDLALVLNSPVAHRFSFCQICFRFPHSFRISGHLLSSLMRDSWWYTRWVKGPSLTGPSWVTDMSALLTENSAASDSSIGMRACNEAPICVNLFFSFSLVLCWWNTWCRLTAWEGQGMVLLSAEFSSVLLMGR